MKRLFKTKKNTLLTYAVTIVFFSCLTLLFLLINCYEASMLIAASGLFNFFYLVVILYYGANPEQQNIANGGKIFVFILLRLLIEVAALATCALLLYFTKNEIFDTKYRMLFILVSLIPYFITIGYFDIHSKLGEDDVVIKDSKWQIGRNV